jgi:hypothetical protein
LAEGHIAAVIEEFARGPVVASDVFDGYGYGRAPVDFLHDAPLSEWRNRGPLNEEKQRAGAG